SFELRVPSWRRPSGCRKNRATGDPSHSTSTFLPAPSAKARLRPGPLSVVRAAICAPPVNGLTSASGFGLLLVRPDSLPEPDEFVAKRAAAEVRVQNGGCIDQVEGVLRLAGTVFGQSHAVPALEPGKRSGCEPLLPEPLDIDGQGIRFEAEVGV